MGSKLEPGVQARGDEVLATSCYLPAEPRARKPGQKKGPCRMDSAQHLAALTFCLYKGRL